jgi:hypothetical protein
MPPNSFFSYNPSQVVHDSMCIFSQGCAKIG